MNTSIEVHLILLGDIYPRNASISIPRYRHSVNAPGHFEELAELVIEVLNSKVVCTYKGHGLEPLDFEGWRNSLQPIVASVIDSYGFLVGGGYAVDFTHAVDVLSGTNFEFPTWLTFLRQEGIQGNINEEFLKVTHLTEQHEGRYFGQALAELSKAVREPFDSPFHAFKAVECIRQIYALRNELDPNSDRAAAWTLMRDDLDIAKEYITDNLEQDSKRVRHGEIVAFDINSRQNILIVAWKIVRTYVDKHSVQRHES